MIIVGFRVTELELINVTSTTCTCPKCQSSELRLGVYENSSKALLGLVSVKKILTELKCAVCGSVVSKSKWSSDIQAIASQKKDQYKPSWLEGGGKIFIIFAVVVLGFGYGIFSMFKEHRDTKDLAYQNYAKCYDSEIKKEWYENLAEGDILMANKDFHDPVAVFRIKSIGKDVIILDLFDFTIPVAEIQEMKSIADVDLSTHSYQEFNASKRSILQDIIIDAATDFGGPNNLYIQQILKK